MVNMSKVVFLTFGKPKKKKKTTELCGLKSKKFFQRKREQRRPLVVSVCALTEKISNKTSRTCF